MESTPLVLTDPNLLAEFARESEFKTFFEKRFATPPDLAAILFRDGELIDSYKGVHISVGGLWENIKGVIGGSHHYALLLADLKPFQVQFPVRGMSVDNVEISGVATVELQLNPEKPSNILGLMGGVTRNEGSAGSPQAGRKALSRFDVLGRIEPHFQDRVFDHIIGRHTAEEIRGNRGLQDQIQADMMQEATRICGDIGVMVKNGSITWAMNEVEREVYARAQIARQQIALDYQLELLKKESAREGEATQVKIQSSVDTAKVKQASEDELALMVLNSQVTFIDAREAVARRQEFEALQHAIDILAKERDAKFGNALGDVKQAISITQSQAILREAQAEIEKFDAFHAAALRDIGRDTEEKDFDQSHAQTAAHAAQARANLAGLNDIESKKAAEEAALRIKEAETATQGKVALMNAGRDLTHEQLSQIMPGLSVEGAQVAIARAQAEGLNSAETIAFAEKVMAESRAHEKDMFQTGMDGGAGMAAGLGGGGFAGGAGNANAASAISECPKCGRALAAKANFCGGCGHQMRT